MEVAAGIWYVVKLVMLILVVALGVWATLFAMLRRKFAGMPRAIMAPIFAVVVAVLAVVSAARPSWIWVLAALVIGAAAGFPIGRLAKPWMRRGKPAVKRWVLGPLVWGTGVVVLAITVLFGTPMLAAIAMIWVVLGVGMVAGGEIGEFSVAPKAQAAPVYAQPAVAPAPAYPPAYGQPAAPVYAPQPYPQQPYAPQPQPYAQPPQYAPPMPAPYAPEPYPQPEPVYPPQPYPQPAPVEPVPTPEAAPVPVEQPPAEPPQG